jgi:diacylglycerol O-acyltransferase / wax synthase
MKTSPATESGCERLSAMDSAFLLFEGPHSHMHIGGPAVFAAGPLATTGRSVDIDRIRAYIDSRLHLVPRYRQRLAYLPIENQPVWVDDEHFHLPYHVRHTSLPRPGNDRQLKRLCGRIMSQPLDRQRPLWELWVVEGLAGGRFALVTKTHHCMVDGIGGVDLLMALLQTVPTAVIEEPPAWRPRPIPTQRQMLRGGMMRRVRMSADLARGLRRAWREPQRARRHWGETLGAVWQTVSAGLQPRAQTPLDQPIGPHRRFDWLTLDLAEVKAIKNHLGGTVNDVALATVAGAVRRFLQQRHVDVDALQYRVAVPVSMRAADDQGTMGNRLSAWLIALPVHERNARRRLAHVCAITRGLKKSQQARGMEALVRLADWTGPFVLRLGVRFAAWIHPYNLIVTNVPGPQLPLYLLGAEMLAGYPQAPLFDNQALAVALLSYNGKLCWGVNADADRVPDLHLFIDATQASFDALRRAAVPAPPYHRQHAPRFRRLTVEALPPIGSNGRGRPRALPLQPRGVDSRAIARQPAVV